MKTPSLSNSLHMLAMSLLIVGSGSLCARAGELVELAAFPEYDAIVQPVPSNSIPPEPAPMPGEPIQALPESAYAGLHNPFAERVEYDPNVIAAEPGLGWVISEAFTDALTSPVEPLAHFFEELLGEEHVSPHTELDHHAIGLQHIPERPDLIFERGEDFLGNGFLDFGFETGTGAVWRPSLWVWGEVRGGYNYIDQRGAPTIDEVASRLDLFGQLNLSGTERVLLALRPLDEEMGRTRSFTSYDFEGDRGIDGENLDVQSLFFEGDFGEVFPRLDPYDTEALDYGFSVGRQPMSFQQGLLINEDMIDALTVTRNTLYGNGNLNLRATGVYAWNRINRNNNVPDDDASMVGLFTESDFRSSTINVDFAYVNSQNPTLRDSLAFGISSIQRVHGFHNTYNSSAHFLASWAPEGETGAAGDGALLFHQLSWTPHHTEDVVYLNAFWAIDQFTSPARGTLAGGPLGQVGILYAAAGLGRYGPALSNQATDAAGGSLGYQWFFDETRQQVVWEIGARTDTNGVDRAAVATALQYQKAMGQHWIFLVNGFVSKREEQGVIPGGRFEVLYRF